jgi:Putative DNA-binding domain
MIYGTNIQQKSCRRKIFTDRASVSFIASSIGARSDGGQRKTMVSDPEIDFASIAELISEGAEETLHREFKTLADATGERLTKDDRRLLAKAICGMANAEGGTITVGVETKRIDNVDVAVAAKPIANAEKLRNLMIAAIPEMLSPQNTGIRVVTAAQDGAAGVVGGDRLHVDDGLLDDLRAARR